MAMTVDQPHNWDVVAEMEVQKIGGRNGCCAEALVFVQSNGKLGPDLQLIRTVPHAITTGRFERVL